MKLSEILGKSVEQTPAVKPSSWRDYLHLTPSERWQAIEPLLPLAKRDFELGEPSEGMDLDQWREMYVKDWHKHKRSDKQNRSLTALERRMVYKHSEREISLRKAVSVRSEGCFKRGARGHTLNTKILDDLPERIAAHLKQSMDDHNTILVHLAGVIITINEELIRYTK